MSDSITKDITGKIHGKGRDGKKRHLNPKMQQKTSTENRRRGEETETYKFKLLTVRNLKNETLQEIETKLKEQQEQLADIALNSGQPVPFPYRVNVNPDGLKSAYAVYVDEDLYGRQNPIYVFTSPDSNIKAFITANGDSKEDYSVHIAHTVERVKNDDDTYTINWRIITIDNRLNNDTPSYYILESQSDNLHPSFRENFDISSLHYLGGGCWTGISVDNKDRIPVKGIVQGDTNAYIPTSNSWKAWGNKRTLSIVSFSITPSYCFTWCRNHFDMKQRIRTASHKTNLNFLQSEGVIKATRQYEYSLDIPQRPDMSNIDVSGMVYQEYSRASCTYVSNTNTPEIAGLEITPDFGTDSQRVAIESYNQESNIIRPIPHQVTPGLRRIRAVNQMLSFNPVCCASPEMASFIRILPGLGVGTINHGYELKTVQASRGFQYGEDYRLWWVYGKIQTFYPTNEGRIFRRVKTAEARGQPSLSPTSETLYNRGELKLSQYPNATETTWPARNNPPTGFFGITVGEATWNIEYNNPPIFGHEAVYYYHINPPLPDIDDSLSQVNETLGENVNDINTQRNVFGQMQGGLGGDSTTNLNLGRVRKASSASDTLPILSPSPSQKADMITMPEKFPVGFWETAIFDETLNPDNSVTITEYNREGGINKSYTT